MSDVMKICTLGPEGTCHENAVKHYLKFQNIKNFEIIYIDNFEDAVNLVTSGKADYIIQNCSHPQVSVICAKYRKEIFTVDTFIFPAKNMGILKTKKYHFKNKNLGLMPATKGYINEDEWDELIIESANPKVFEGLKNGKYEYGVTFVNYAKYNDDLEIVESFGDGVVCAWIVYGKERRFTGDLIGTYQEELFKKYHM